MGELNVDSIFGRAIEIAGEAARSAFVGEACGGDKAMQARVQELLAAHFKESEFMDKPAGDLAVTVDDPPPTDQTGSEIGPYKLLQRLGEGGMGVVYMAEQTEPIRRRVALKLVKPGMDSRQVIARFEAERQALALMDHPNIAKVLDAGTTGAEKGDGGLLGEAPAGPSRQKTPVPFFEGRPYFVMELVMGVPITQYCNERHLSPHKRLELFVPVCQAVQHAHQKGIIHRDIKPSNVLVAEFDDKAVPKIIDFGVAKALYQQLTQRTMFTQFGQVVGTWEYMSPEQAKLNQLDIDTRSDIYSLGVLLYELLTGHTPFDRKRLRSAAFDEILRIIREEEPPRPSVKLSTIETLPAVAANCGTEPRALGTLVRGDLDLIVMKALEKDRGRRYPTATAFADDVERFLSDEPVQARALSPAYRFKKFVRRNRASVVVAAVLLVSLIAGVIGTTIQWLRAEQLATNNRILADDNERRRQEAVDAERRANITSLAAKSREIQAEWPILSALLAIETVNRSRDLDGEVMPAAHEALLNATMGIPGKTLAGHTQKINATAISPDNRWVITASDDTTIRLWDLTKLDHNPPPIVLTGHKGGITDVAISSDSGWLATASMDATVRLWDLQSNAPGSIFIQLTDHTGPVHSVEFSADGRLLVTGGSDKTVRIWDMISDGVERRPLVLHGAQRGGYDAHISPDGRWVVAVQSEWHDDPRAPRLWDLSLEDPNDAVHDFPGHARFIDSITFSPDSRRLLTTAGRRVVIWDLLAKNPADNSYELSKYIQGSGVQQMVLTPDDRWLATAADRLQLWDMHFDDPSAAPRVLAGHEGFVTGIDISADGRWLISGGYDRTVRIWDLSLLPESDPSIGHVVLPLHGGRIEEVHISSNGRWIISRTRGSSQVRLWDRENPGASSLVLRGARSGSIDPKFKRRVGAMAMDKAGRLLVTGAEDGSVRLFDLESAYPGWSYRELHGYDNRVQEVGMTDDGRWVIAGGLKDHALLWDLSDSNGFQIPFKLRARAGNHGCVAISPDGRWAVTGVDPPNALLWNLEADNPATAPTVLRAETDIVAEEIADWSFAISPDSRWLLSKYYYEHVLPRLWKLDSSNISATRRVLHATESKLFTAEFTPDSGKLLSADRNVHIYGLKSPQPSVPATLIEGDSKTKVWRHAISPDGRWLVTSTYDWKTTLYDLLAKYPEATRHEILGVHGTYSLDISSDSRWLAVGSTDGTVRLWDLDAAKSRMASVDQTMRILRGHEGSVWYVMFSPDRRWLISGGDGGNVILWPMQMDDLLQRARRAAGRELTDEERERYGAVSEQPAG